VNEYSFRINPDSGEIHIFIDGEEWSLCNKVNEEETQLLSVNRKTGKGKSRPLRRLESLSLDAARGMAASIAAVRLNICGVCLSSLYRTER